MGWLRRAWPLATAAMLASCGSGPTASDSGPPRARASTTPAAPSCATAAPHLRAAHAALEATPPQSGVAQREYAEALRIHQGGCRLSNMALWTSLQGLARAYFQQDSYDAAVPHLRRAAQIAPGIDQSHYDLACALCRTGDVDGCYRELETALTAAAAGRPPSFMDPGIMFSPAHHVRASRAEPSFARLRADPRYEPLVTRYGHVNHPGRP